MTTLNAMANNAYHALVAETERENPGDVWAGFENERDAFEAGYEAALQAQPAASRERMIEVLGGSELAAATVDHLLAAGVFREPEPVDREALARAAHHYFCIRRDQPNHDPRQSDYDKADEILEILALINGG